MEQEQNERWHRPKRTEVRSRILEAAKKLFTQEGFAGASLDDIAKEAGFSKGAVYSNFANKDEVLVELIDQQIVERIAQVGDTLEEHKAAADSKDSVGEKVSTMGKRLYQIVDTSPEWEILFIEYWLRAVHHKDLGQRFGERRLAMQKAVAEFIKNQAKSMGVSLKLSPEELAITSLALSNGFGIEKLINKEAVPPELLGKILSYMVKGMLMEQQSS